MYICIYIRRKHLHIYICANSNLFPCCGLGHSPLLVLWIEDCSLCASEFYHGVQADIERSVTVMIPSVS